MVADPLSEIREILERSGFEMITWGLFEEWRHESGASFQFGPLDGVKRSVSMYPLGALTVEKKRVLDGLFASLLTIEDLELIQPNPAGRMDLRYLEGTCPRL